MELCTTLNFKSEEARRNLDVVLKTLEDHLLDTVNSVWYYRRLCLKDTVQERVL